jgi:hypothetical protein
MKSYIKASGMKDAYNRSKEEHEEYHHLGHELL